VSAALYERGADRETCEWCGREGEEIPLHVRGQSGSPELASPVLCEVCQGLLGLIHPHKYNVTSGNDPVAVKEKVDRCRGVAVGEVLQLLSERYRADGRPRPSWAAQWPAWPPEVRWP